jgi:hypothetical protein
MLAQLPFRFAIAVGAASPDNDIRPSAREPIGEGKPQTGIPASHQGDLTGQVEQIVRHALPLTSHAAYWTSIRTGKRSK